MSILDRLIRARRGPFRRVVREVLSLYGLEIPAHVEIGSGLQVMHRGFGVVLHPRTVIGNNVTIYHGVTIGRGDVWVPEPESSLEGFIVEDDAIICAGAKIVCARGFLTVGKGAVIGANAVVTKSVPAGEIWAGCPARKIGTRS
jgi:serine O-acetyltransferase